MVEILSYLGVGIVSADTSLATSTISTIVSGMLTDIVSLFTDNIGTVLTFAVSFMALSLLLALGRRFFRV